MREAVDCFRQALTEQGLEATVTHESDGYNDTFYITKDVAGETAAHKVTIPTDGLLDESSVEKEIALTARKVARQFREFLSDTFEWQDRSVNLCLYDDPEARCGRCGTTVSITKSCRVFTEEAELSTPKPFPVDNGSILESLDSHSVVVLKMYLIGKLRDKCDEGCSNSRATERFI